MKLTKFQQFVLAIMVASGLVLHAPKANARVYEHDLICLAKNIYYEARGESQRGKLAVAQVTLNRVENKNYHNTICGVVYAKNQFSWTFDRTLTRPYGQAWLNALELAAYVLDEGIAIPNFRALHFHAKSITPAWSKTRVRIAQIGGHVFYN